MAAEWLRADQVAAIAARAAKASPPPWTYAEPENAKSRDPYKRESYITGPRYVPIPDALSLEPDDARFMAHARQDVDDLLAQDGRWRALVGEAIRVIVSLGDREEVAWEDWLVQAQAALDGGG